MNTRNWLSRYRELMEEIDRETREAHYWEDIAIGLSPSKFSYGSKSTTRKDMGDYVARFLDIASHCSQLGEEATIAKDQILEVIDSLDNLIYRRILRMKYIDGLTHREIAERLHYSMGYIRRMHSRAIKEVTKSNTYICYNVQ